MLLKLNNNRFLYANIMRRPDKYADKVEYELRKHLRIRLYNMTNADVVRLEAKVIPAAKQTLASPPAVVSTDAELPKANVARGRRADHDRLPAEVQALWDKNFTLYQTIKDLFERLKAMEKAQPCDRYEYLKLLDDADKQYRANLENYDNYVAPSAPSASSPTSTAAKAKSPTENAEDSTSRDTDYRKINAARKTLSKYKKVFANAIEQGDFEKAAAWSDNAVKGCKSHVWLHAWAENGRFRFHADSDTYVIKGLLYLLMNVLDGRSLEAAAAAELYFWKDPMLLGSFDDRRQKGIGYVAAALQSNGVVHKISSVSNNPRKKNAPPPFITSTPVPSSLSVSVELRFRSEGFICLPLYSAE